MKQRNLAIALLTGLLLLIAGVAAAGPNTAIFRAIIVQNDAAVGNDLVIGGDTTIDGGLTVTGGVTGTNVLTTGNQTVGGVKTLTSVLPANAGITVDTTAFTVADTSGNVATAGTLSVGGGYGATGCSVSAAGILQCNGAATFDGAVTTGALTSLTPILVKDANYPVVAADSGAIIKNTSVLSVTFTLPAAAVGLNFCVFNYSASDVIIEFADSADVALNEVNSAGDPVTNTTAYDSICLTAIDAVNWITISSVGTWADGA